MIKKRILFLMVIGSLAAASPDIASAQQAGGTAATVAAQTQTVSKNWSAADSTKPKVEKTRTRCRTPVCFRDNPGGYFTGPPKKNY